MCDLSALGQRAHDAFQIFNASHMAPFDVPHVTHDMILRFMGVNFSAIVDGSARIPSSIGTKTKPVFIVTSTGKSTNLPVSGKTPEQDKAMWEGELPAWLCLSFANVPSNQHITTQGPLRLFSSLSLLELACSCGAVCVGIVCDYRRKTAQRRVYL